MRNGLEAGASDSPRPNRDGRRAGIVSRRAGYRMLSVE
jgi:hypothetical protein